MGLRPRQGFSGDQLDTAWDRQGGECPCCAKSLSRVDWDAHHRSGDRGDNSTANLVLCCERCHHLCYHDERGVSRKPVNCRVVKPTTSTRTGRACSCVGCRDCTSPYRVLHDRDPEALREDVLVLRRLGLPLCGGDANSGRCTGSRPCVDYFDEYGSARPARPIADS